MLTRSNIVALILKAAALVIVLLAATLGGCGGTPPLETDALLEPAMSAFLAEAAAHNVTTTPFIAVFGELHTYIPGHIGQCLAGVVTFDAHWWLTADTSAREAAFLHEAGHCGLGLGHVEGWTLVFNPDAGAFVRTPQSVMSAQFIGGYAFAIDRTRYIDGVFQ